MKTRRQFLLSKKRRTDLAEAALVEHARTDPAAFGYLYKQYVDRVYSYIYHRVGNVQDA